MRSARLLRVVLIAAAASAIAACGHKADDHVQVVPGAPAGDVTEASGEVSAIRDGKPRAIKAGDVVSGDDVIKTGAGARVTIVLRHNHVPWSLGPAQEKKVADSAAWLAAAGASGDVVTDDKSGAAGRHAERSATDTAASSGGGGGSSVSAAGSASGAGSASAPGSGSSAEDQARAEAEAKARAMEEQLASAKIDAEKQRLEEELAKAEAEQRLKGSKGRGGGDGDRRAPKCDPADPLCGLDDGPGGGGKVTAKGNGEADVEGAIDPAQIRSAIQARAGALRACYAKLTAQGAATGKLVMKLTVGPDGKVVKAELGGDDALAPMYDCIRGVVTKIAFPKPGGTITFSYPMTFK